ncbi:MAG: S24 family peptidase [Fimbriimonadales bacterium]
MGWADFAKEALAKGQTAVVKPRGHSMTGKVNDGDIVTVSPVDTSTLLVDDIVLVRVKGRDFLHLIKAIDGERVLIGNNRGGVNGWVGKGCVYGKAIAIENRR